MRIVKQNQRVTTNKKKNSKKYIPLTASIIASVLLALSPKYQVVAEKAEENDSQTDIKTLHKEYHSLLTSVASESKEAQELVEEDTEETPIDEPTLVSDNDEIKIIKDALIIAIEEVGSPDLAAQLQTDELTVEDLGEIFVQLFEEQAILDEVKEPAEEPIEDSAEKPVEEPVEDSVEEPIEVLAEKPVEEPAEEPVEDAAEEPIEETEIPQIALFAGSIPVEEPTEEEVPVKEIEVTTVVQDEVEPEIVSEEVTEEPVEELPIEETEETVVAEKEGPEVISEEETVESAELEADTTETESETEVEETAEPVALMVASAKASPQARVASAPAKTASIKTVVYTVRSGDTLNKIAKNHGVSVDHLVSLNSIVNKNIIQVGKQLLISGKKEDLGQLNKNLTHAEFINIVGASATEIAGKNNLYASVMTAQAALESGYGSSSLSTTPNYNLFGIKGSYNGESAVMRTREHSNSAGWHYVNAPFKKYPSYNESLLDNAHLLRNGTSWNSNYYAGTWLENAASYKEATAWLEGRYATDPTYAKKLNSIIELYNLTRFDLIESEDVVVTTPSNDEETVKDVTPSTGDKAPVIMPENTNTTAYKVKSGDTLSHIARAYNTSVNELKQLNNLKSDLIFVNQTLKVKGSTPAPKPVPAPKPTTPTQNNATTYKVKSGDTLSHIAIDYNMSVNEIKQLNDLRSNSIYVGQNLKVNGTTPASKPTAPTQNNATTYKVKSGDTLSHISRAYNTSVAELKQLNNLKSDSIYVGQSLKVNGTTPAPKPTAPTQSSGTTYKVKSGDTLSHISRAYNTSVAELKQLNNLKTDLIYVGQSLKVNGTSKSVTSSNSQSSSKPSNNANITTTHTVQSGDTLSGIAKKQNVSIVNLVSWNNLNNRHLIYVNQKLVIKSSTTTPAPEKNQNTAGKSYKIERGDTLSHIAIQFNISMSELKAKNNLKTDLIFVGQTLKV